MTQRRSVLQDWVQQLTFMQQSVLLSSIRGADGLHKDHISKYILRWLRRCVLISAFDGRALETPTEEGGGSFTGPLKHQKVEKWDGYKNLPSSREYNFMVLKHVSEDYLRSTDEIPHHFHMHVVHAAEIIGYKHPINWIADWWHDFYLKLVSDAHLHPETETEMDRRLGDVEAQWKEREAVPAADVPKMKEEWPVKDSVIFNERSASYLAGQDLEDTLWVFARANALKMSLKDATEFVNQSYAKEHLVIKKA